MSQLDFSKYAQPTPQDDGILSAVGLTAKRTGSKLLDILMNLDRPRRALWLGIEAGVNDKDILKAMKEGWSLDDDLRTMDFFSKEFKEEHKILAPTLGFVGDVLGDPLTYVGAGVAKSIGKGISAVTPQKLKNLGINLGQTDLARALGVYTGDVRVAKEAADVARLRVAGKRHTIEGEVSELRKGVKQMAAVAGVSYDDAARAFSQAIEKPKTRSGLAITPEQMAAETERLMDADMKAALEAAGGIFSPELSALAKAHKLDYQRMLDLEKASGVKIDDILRNAKELGVDAYVPHILGPEGRRYLGGRKSFKEWFRSPAQHGSALPRTIPGTIEDINVEFGKKLGREGFMHTDPALMMGVRAARHETAISGVNYLKTIGSKLGRPTEVWVDGSGRLIHGVKVMGMKNIDLPGGGKWFDPKVAKLIEEQHKLLVSPRFESKFLKHFDELQGLWKMWSLGVRPAYHVRNLVGNIWNAYSLAGVKNPEVYRQAAMIQNQASRNLLSETEKIGGYTHRQLYDEAIERGIIGRGQYGADVTKTLERTLEGQMGRAGLGGYGGRLYGTESLPLRYGFKFGSMVENNARLAVFINHVKKGKIGKLKTSEDVLDHASMMTKKALFDYSDLSAFEQNVFKRFIPFYTWSRKNIPAQIEGILKNPQRYQKLTTAREQIEYGEGRPSPDATDWYGKRVPIYLGKEGESDVWKMISLLNYAPVADLERLGSPKDLLFEMTTPFLKEPIEQLINYSAYRHKEIQKYKGQTEDFLGVRMPKRMAHLAQLLVPIAELNRANPFGIFGEAKMTEQGRLESTKSFDSLKGKLPFVGDWEIELPGEGLTVREPTSGYDLERGSRLLRYLTGLRVYPVDEAKGRYWENKNFESDLRQLQSYLKWAALKGKGIEMQEVNQLIQQYLTGETPNPLLR